MSVMALIVFPAAVNSCMGTLSPLPENFGLSGLITSNLVSPLEGEQSPASENFSIFSENAIRDHFLAILPKIRVPAVNRQKVTGFGQTHNENALSDREKEAMIASDPILPAVGFSYPQWIFKKSGDAFQRLEEPINIVWRGTTVEKVEAELISHAWFRVSGPLLEDTYYIYDKGWEADTGMATDPIGLFGRYHIRLWQLTNGDVIGAVHHDIWWNPLSDGHHADGHELAKNYTATIFQDSGQVYERVIRDFYRMDNCDPDLDSDGYATGIFPF